MASSSASASTSQSVPRTLSIPATPYAGQGKANNATKSKTSKQDSKGKGKAKTIEYRTQEDTQDQTEPTADANTGYGASDDEAPEAEAARISPLKNGARATSAVSSRIVLSLCASDLEGSAGPCQV